MRFSLRTAIATLSVLSALAAAIHYDVASRANVNRLLEKVATARGIAVADHHLSVNVGGIELYSRPQITHLYLSGTMELAVENDGSRRLLRVKRERARWLLEEHSPIASVEVVEANATDIGDGECVMLSRLRSLRLLELAGTEITGDGIRSLAANNSLRRLDISFTDIVDKDLNALVNMTSLREVTIEGCGISDEAIQKLQREKPTIVVRRRR